MPISLEKFKKHLGKEAGKYTEEEIEKLKDCMYKWADLLFDFWLEDKKKKSSALVKTKGGDYSATS